MKLFKKMKDGGKDSVVTGYWLIECKSLFSIVLLKFENGSRNAYHSHAFNAISWIISGYSVEKNIDRTYSIFRPSIKPIYTPRSKFHKVTSFGTTWALTFRGPWSKEWKEYLPDTGEYITLTEGRVIKGNVAE